MTFCPRLNFALTRLFPVVGFQIITELRSPEDSPCLGETSYLTDARRMPRFRWIATFILIYFRSKPACIPGVPWRDGAGCHQTVEAVGPHTERGASMRDSSRREAGAVLPAGLAKRVLVPGRRSPLQEATSSPERTRRQAEQVFVLAHAWVLCAHRVWSWDRYGPEESLKSA